MMTFLMIAAIVVAAWTAVGLLVGALIGTTLRRARTEACLREILSTPARAHVYATIHRRH